jgi:ATP-dependent Clp protease adaptor protein ClpS
MRGERSRSWRREEQESTDALRVARRGAAHLLRLNVTTIFSSTQPQQETHTELALAGACRVVVLNDPVNLMSYVVLVFKKVFGFDERTARKHMLEVHELGRSVVWTGLREKAEAYAFTLHEWHLTAIIETDEKN